MFLHNVLIVYILNYIKKLDILLLFFLHILFVTSVYHQSVCFDREKANFAYLLEIKSFLMKYIRMQSILIPQNEKKLVISLVHDIKK